MQPYPASEAFADRIVLQMFGLATRLACESVPTREATTEKCMHKIEIEQITTELARSRYEGIVPFCEMLDDVRSYGEPLAMETKLAAGECFPDVPTLFIWLPAAVEGDLRFLSASGLDMFNQHSADLRSLTTYIALRGAVTEVRVNAWALSIFPGLIETRRFRFVLAAGETTVVATHYVDAYEIDTMLSALQGCCIASGPNYVPRAIWSDAQMLEARGRIDSTAASILTACVLRPDAGS